ncbi:MAG TPA: hypothetical protein PLB31_04455 [Fimbriimonadaceae bacterium]|nr:hypothetical protein [Fimbriimonadaceae bacterium]HRE93768.1 hypothetical protein [Fimbriimonadaceae bacterium]HRI73704.1 hypothetical protein [Fimbriimonadaceae bacterium]
MPPNALWSMMFFNLAALSLWGFYWWAHSGNRTMIFYGLNNLETDLKSAWKQAGIVGLLTFLVFVNYMVFTGYEYKGEWWPVVVCGVTSNAYYYWRRAVAFKREKERLARSKPPSVLPDK